MSQQQGEVLVMVCMRRSAAAFAVECMRSVPLAMKDPRFAAMVEAVRGLTEAIEQQPAGQPARSGGGGG